MRYLTTLVLTTTLVLAGCGQDAAQDTDAAQQTSEPETTAVALPNDFFLTEAPAEPRGVGEVKADDGAAGDVVVFGRIGGRKEPFVPGMAVFLLTDRKIKTCDELHGDGCPTPWDYCCEPKESLMANLATIRVVGDDGRPLRVDLAGKHGLDPSAEIVVQGEIESREGGNLVINAEHIHVKPDAG